MKVVGTHESRVTVTCHIFSRDYDEETGYIDVVLGEEGSDPPDTTGLRCVAKYNGVFHLRPSGPAMLLEQPLPPSWGYKDMPREMANAIASFITPAKFPEAAEHMWREEHEQEYEEEQEYPEDEDARSAFWASVSQQVSTMTAAGDPWGALKVQREAVDRLINWVDPPVEVEKEPIPEPKLEDIVQPAYSLLEEEDEEDEEEEEEDNYLPLGSHLLPSDFQAFLQMWNKTIADSTGDWLGERRQAYMEENPEIWRQFQAKLDIFKSLYPAQVEAIKAYQASQASQAS